MTETYDEKMNEIKGLASKLTVAVSDLNDAIVFEEIKDVGFSHLGKISPGEILVTEAHYIGIRENAFFDNYIHLAGNPNERFWIPDPNTWIKNPNFCDKDTGKMNGFINQYSLWGWPVPKNIVPGKYLVSSRLYFDTIENGKRIKREHVVLGEMAILIG